jgi:hypothetical protein
MCCLRHESDRGGIGGVCGGGAGGLKPPTVSYNLHIASSGEIDDEEEEEGKRRKTGGWRPKGRKREMSPQPFLL